MAAYWRSLISDSNTPEVNAALKDSADFMDKLIAQKEAEQEKSRQSDIANLTAAILGLTEVITIQNERVGNAPKAKSPEKKTENLKAEQYQQIIDAYNDNCGKLPKHILTICLESAERY